MTTNFLIVGDIHYKGVNPAARLDNYQEALNRKLQEINVLAAKYECKAIIQTGDMFDSPGVSYPVLIDLMNHLPEENNWVTIPGNHDLYAANHTTWQRTPLAVMDAAGCVTILDDTALRSFAWYGVKLYGRGYWSGIDDTPINYNCPIQIRPGVVTIGVYHGTLVPEPIHPDIKHTLIRDISSPADVTICGHIHNGFGIIRRPDGKLFINPGALCRDSASEADIRRQVQVCLLTVHDNGETEAKMIPLQSARPGHEVLSREHIEIAREKAQRFEQFLSLLQEQGESKFLQVNEILDDLTTKKELPPAAKTMALDYLARAREELSRP